MDGQVNSLNILHFQIQLPLKFIYTNILQLILISLKYSHCKKIVQIRRFYWRIFSRIQSPYSVRIQKIRTKKTVFGDFQNSLKQDNFFHYDSIQLTDSRSLFPSYRPQPVNFYCKSKDWFLYGGNIGLKMTQLNISNNPTLYTPCFPVVPLQSCTNQFGGDLLHLSSHICETPEKSFKFEFLVKNSPNICSKSPTETLDKGL